MKLLICLVLSCFLVGSFAQTVSNWDLSSLDSGSAEVNTAPVQVLDRKADNQGFTSTIQKSGETASLQLTVTKERSPQVTDVDQLLFGLSVSEVEDSEYTNMTFSREETVDMVRSVLGDSWETQVQLPSEDLTYIELLRLGASLNEYSLLSAGAGARARSVRGPKWPYRCICHGTKQPYPNTRAPWDKGAPYYGVRVIVPGYPVPIKGKKQPTKDCILCDPDNSDTLQTDTDVTYDCRYCCFGKCVLTGNGESGWPNDLDVCEMDYTLDEDTETPKYGYPNFVGRCTAPRTLKCKEAVTEYCTTCSDVTDVYNSETDKKTRPCSNYCEKAVGWSSYFCSSCSKAIAAIDTKEETGFGCSCNDVFWHIAHPGKGGPKSESGAYESGESGYGYESGKESGSYWESGSSSESGKYGYYKESGSHESGAYSESGKESGSYYGESGKYGYESGSWAESGKESGSWSESGKESGSWKESGSSWESGSWSESGKESGSWSESGSSWESGSWSESGSESGSWSESGKESGSYYSGWESGESGSWSESGKESGSYYAESGSHESGAYSESGSGYESGSYYGWESGKW